MRFENFKRVFLQILIGCLVAAAAIAVISVLIGKFNDVLGKALFTLLIIAVHSLLSFGFIVSNEKRKASENLAIFTNAAFVIIVLSFITAVFGIWHIFPGELVGRLYGTYFILLFAILHGEVLAQTLKKQKSIDNIVYANYVFMAIVVCMLVLLIFLSSTVDFGSVYYRFLAACGIVDATLTLLAVIMHKLYLQKHPTIQSPVFIVQGVNTPNGQTAPATSQPGHSHRVLSIFGLLLIIYLVLQLVAGFAFVVIGRLHH